MVALVMVAGGLVLVFVGAPTVFVAVFDTSSSWWVRPLGFLGALAAVAGVVLVLRGVGVGYVGLP